VKECRGEGSKFCPCWLDFYILPQLSTKKRQWMQNIFEPFHAILASKLAKVLIKNHLFENAEFDASLKFVPKNSYQVHVKIVNKEKIMENWSF
jgi:hypothetical protein